VGSHAPINTPQRRLGVAEETMLWGRELHSPRRENAAMRHRRRLSAGPFARRRGPGRRWPNGRDQRRICRPTVPGSRMAAVAASGRVVLLRAVVMGGFVRYLRGDQSTKWSTIER
jgi:hypothetical protein